MGKWLSIFGTAGFFQRNTQLILAQDSQLASISRLKQAIKDNEGLLSLAEQKEAIATMSEALEELKVVLEKVNAGNPEEVDRIDLGIRINEKLLREMVYEDFQREIRRGCKRV